MRRVLIIGVVGVVLGLGLPARAAVQKRYTSCTKLVAVYPKGVACTGAADMVNAGQQRATGYVVDTKLYTLNKPLDIDRDGIACELLAAAVQPVVPPVPDAEPSTAVRLTQPPLQPTVPPPTAPPATAPPITSTQPTAPPQPVTRAPLQTTPGPVLRRFRNCAELNAVYPHGVGRSDAVDSTSGTERVTTFLVDDALYLVQPGTLDRDNDGIACEKP